MSAHEILLMVNVQGVLYYSESTVCSAELNNVRAPLAPAVQLVTYAAASMSQPRCLDTGRSSQDCEFRNLVNLLLEAGEECSRSHLVDVERL